MKKKWKYNKIKPKRIKEKKEKLAKSYNKKTKHH